MTESIVRIHLLEVADMTWCDYTTKVMFQVKALYSWIRPMGSYANNGLSLCTSFTIIRMAQRIKIHSPSLFKLEYSPKTGLVSKCSVSNQYCLNEINISDEFLAFVGTLVLCRMDYMQLFSFVNCRTSVVLSLWQLFT